MRFAAPSSRAPVAAAAVSFAALAVLPPRAAAAPFPLNVTVENLASPNGFFITPVWVAFHDGSFDTFTQGFSLGTNNPFERLVEDGVTGPISQAFINSPAGLTGGTDTTVTAPGGTFSTPPVFAPGEISSRTITADTARGRYFTFAAMVIPSNDAFIGNDDPTSMPVFDPAGNFTGPVTFMIRGDNVSDAGTEANTEQDAAFFNQFVNGDGASTPNDVVAPHHGLLGSFLHPQGTRVILGGTTLRPVPGIFFDPVAADFTANTFVARITITAVPDPTPALLAPLLLLTPTLLRPRRPHPT